MCESVPAKLRGTVRAALRTGLRLAAARASPQEEFRGWKLLGHARIAPEELERRSDLFVRGLWPQLFHQATQAARTSQLASRTAQAEDAGRASRAAALVHLGELSAAARALVAEPLAPGTDATELRDPAGRPPEPYAPLAPEVAAVQPAEACPLPA